MKRLFCFILPAVMFTAVAACTSDIDEYATPNDAVSAVEDDHVSLDEALASLEEVLELIDVPTRGGCRQIESIATITDEDLPSRRNATRATLAGSVATPPSDLVYVTNFTNNNGYAVLGATKKLAPVIAVTDRGYMISDSLKSRMIQFDAANVPNNGALYNNLLYCTEDEDYYIGNNKTGDNDFVMDGVAQYALFNGLANSDLQRYRNNDSANERLYDDSDAILWSIYDDIISRLKWSQGNPFNYRITKKDSNENRCVAGCTTIAVAQFLVGDKRLPLKDKFGLEYVTWDEIEDFRGYVADTININNIAQYDSLANKVAIFIKKIADGIDVKYNYGVGSKKGTYATPTKVKKYLENLGYNVSLAKHDSKHLEEKEINIIKESIAKGFPVLISCLEKDICEGGHMWLIDGYIMRGAGVLVHCNWGWRGVDNGYFFIDMLNSDQGAYMYNENDSKVSGCDFDYGKFWRIVSINGYEE